MSPLRAKKYEAIVPRNARQREVLNLIKRLANGRPLLQDAGYNVLATPRQNELLRFRETVENYRRQGPIGDRHVLWLTAPRGGGKTETLAKLERSLAQEDYDPRLAKSLVVRVDLKAVQERGASVAEEIFFTASLNSTSPFKGYLQDIAQSRAKRSQLESKALVGTIELGLDTALAVAGVPAPGAGMVLGRTWQWLVRYYKLHPKRLLAKLAEGGITTPAFLLFFIEWMRFTTAPNERTLRALTDEVKKISKSKLFLDFSKLLSIAGYSTMVLLFDEADELPDSPELYRDLERIYNSGEEAANGLNIIFCLAGSEPKILGLRNEVRYGGFSRRLLGTPESPHPLVTLDPPLVLRDRQSADDFDHAKKVYTELASVLGVGILRFPKTEQEDQLRQELSTKCTAGELTWHGLWAAVYDFLFTDEEQHEDEMALLTNAL